MNLLSSKFFHIFFLILSMVNVVRCDDPPYNRTRIEHALRKFSARFLHQVLQKDSEKNILINFKSLHLHLLLAYLASKAETKHQIMTALGLRDQSDQFIQLYAKNLLELEKNYAQKSGVDIYTNRYMTSYELKWEFRKIATESFDIKCEEDGDFDAAALNRLIKFYTRSFFERVFRDQDFPAFPIRPLGISVDTMILEAPFGYVYDEIRIKNEYFYKFGRDKEKMSMLNMKGIFRFADLPKYDASCVIIPFENDNVELMIMLPYERDGLRTMDALLATSNVNRLSLPMKRRRMELTIPIFEARYNIRYREYFERLGITSLFNENAAIPNMFYVPVEPRVFMARQLADFIFTEDGIKISSVSSYTYAIKDNYFRRKKRATTLNTSLDGNDNKYEAKAHKQHKLHRVRRQYDADDGPEIIKFKADHPFTFFVYSDQHLYLVGHFLDQYRL